MKFKYLAFIGLLPICFQAQATDFSYNTIEISIGSVQPDEGDNGLGVQLSGTIEMGSVFYAGAGISHVRFEDVKQKVTTLGIGLHLPLGENTDIYAELLALQADIDVTNYGSVDDSGRGANLGLRHMATDKFELTGGIEYIDIFDDTDSAPYAGVRYHSTEKTSVGFIISKPEDATSYTLSVKVNY